MTLVAVASCLRARASGLVGSGEVVIIIPAVRSMKFEKPSKYDVGSDRMQTLDPCRAFRTISLCSRWLHLDIGSDRTGSSPLAGRPTGTPGSPHLDGDRPGQL